MESISSVLFSLFRNTPHHDDWIVACLRGAWHGLLGEKLANVCRPARLRNRELTVEVADAAWLPALSSMREELLARLREAAGNEVRSLAFVSRDVESLNEY